MTVPSLTTRFTELVGCDVPIQLAGLGGGIGTPELAVAVARAGGLGIIGHMASAQQLSDALDRCARADMGGGRLGVNFLVPFLFDPAPVEAAASRVRVVDFFYSDPDSALVARVHAGGALASWQVGGADEARAAVEAGCDLVVAQGTEAGGHVRGTLPMRQVLDEVMAAVSVPVLAAGGIATGHAMAEALAVGAGGVRIGTRFVAAEESGAHPDYVAALVAAGGDDTVLTTQFGADWPDAPHRVLRSCVAAAESLEAPRWSSRPPTVATEGDVAAMALYAGAGVGAVRNRQPAARIVEELVTEALA